MAEAAAEAAAEARRRRAEARARRKFHPGPGIWDDYKPIFSRAGRRELGEARVAQLEREFQADFRLTVKSFSVLLEHCRDDLGGTPGLRGSLSHHR